MGVSPGGVEGTGSRAAVRAEGRRPHLGCPAVHSQVGGWDGQGDSGRAGNALTQGPPLLCGQGFWRCGGFSADPSLHETGGSSRQGTYIPGVCLHCEGHSVPPLGLCPRMYVLGGVAGQGGGVRGPGNGGAGSGLALGEAPHPPTGLGHRSDAGSYQRPPGSAARRVGAGLLGPPAPGSAAEGLGPGQLRLPSPGVGVKSQSIPS